MYVPYNPHLISQLTKQKTFEIMDMAVDGMQIAVAFRKTCLTT